MRGVAPGSGPAHQVTESSSTWAGPRAEAVLGAPQKPPAAHASAQRLPPERGKGAWTTAEQRRSLPRRRRRLPVRDAWVRPQTAPGCLAFFRLPGSKDCRLPRSAVLSAPATRPGWLQYGEGGLLHGHGPLPRGVRAGDRKVDGGGYANGEETCRWTLRVQPFSRPRADLARFLITITCQLPKYLSQWLPCFSLRKLSLALPHRDWR